nr:hypothetical protein [Tanacetum cinerariifolium]
LGLFKKINERGVRLDSGGSNKDPFGWDFCRQPCGGGIRWIAAAARGVAAIRQQWAAIQQP